MSIEICKTCCGQGEVFSGHYQYFGEFQPPEPYMDVCPDCGGKGAFPEDDDKQGDQDE